jgi:hypothetical protein
VRDPVAVARRENCLLTGRPVENAPMFGAGSSRLRLTRALQAAYAQGLISEETFVVRVNRVLDAPVIDPGELVGDLTFRGSGRWERVSATLGTALGRLELARGEAGEPPSTLLALDWSGHGHELLLGRHHRCDVVLGDLSVSRRHAKLVFRDGHWVIQDLGSTNGTAVNGRRVGRCELRPGDRLLIGAARLRID